MPTADGPRRPLLRAIGWTLAVLVAFATFAGWALTFLVFEHTFNRVAAIAAVLGLLLAPVAPANLAEKVATRFRRAFPTLRCALVLVVATAVGAGITLVGRLPEPTARALFAAPDRHPSAPGFVAELSRSAARTLAPNLVWTAPSAALPLGPAPAPPASPPALSGAPTSPQAASVATASTPVTTGPVTRRVFTLELPAGGPPSTHADGPPRFSAGNPAYTEPVDACETLAPIEELKAAYVAGNERALLEGLAKVRYPEGLRFLQVQDDKMFASWLTDAPRTFDDIADRFDTEVHEGSHYYDFKHAKQGRSLYAVHAQLSIEPKRGKTFDRSEILDAHVDRANDGYADIYLTGRSGAQGFHVLLDEYNAYIHGLAARYCTRDLIPPRRRLSARDGALTMMYYVEVYLALAREKHPKDYAAIVGDPAYRAIILTGWDRAELWLRRSAPHESLGLHDTTIEGWVYAPERLAEIARVRAVAP